MTKLPSIAKLTAGLDLESVHPPLVRVRESVANHEQTLERRRRDLAAAETLVAELPAKIARGQARADSLRAAIVDRDSYALMVSEAETALTRARTAAQAEEGNAKAELEREYVRRVDVLQAAAVEHSVGLEQLLALADALAAKIGPGTVIQLDWPSSPMVDAQRRAAAMASQPATPSLAWSGSKL